jgi:outer membrane cobalamin receptor
MTEALTVDLSSSKTSTQLDQELKTRRLGIDYQATDHLNFTAAISRVSATAVVTKRTIFPGIPAWTIPAGTTVMPATDDTYSEIGLGWTF